MSEQQHQKHRLYGRAAGKPLSKRQQALIDDVLPTLGIPATAAGQLQPASLFDGKRDVWLEIGFGGGEHLAGQATRHPDVGFIGAEPFVDGVAKLLTALDEQALSNVKVRRGDARDLVAQFADKSIDRGFILFPDPWPKTRHRKRRLVQSDFIVELARILKPGARLRLATDWADYANRALADVTRSGLFDWTAARANDWRVAPADHVTTRYQEKRLGDCAPVFLDFVRV